MLADLFFENGATVKQLQIVVRVGLEPTRLARHLPYYERKLSTTSA